MSPFIFVDKPTRIELSGVDISEYIRGAGGRYRLDPWQRAALKLFLTPFETSQVRQARRARRSRMRAAYRSRRR